MRASLMGVAQRVDVRVKVPFAARVRTRVALVHRRFFGESDQSTVSALTVWSQDLTEEHHTTKGPLSISLRKRTKFPKDSFLSFCTMPNNKNNPKAKRTPTVEETNAALEKEFAGIDSKG